MSLLLAIESSCDEMAMAVLKDQREFLSSVVASQIDIHAMYGGVVPEIASRKHVECVSVVLKETLKQANIKMEDLDAICVTKGPGLVGSLHIGLQVAKTLSLAYDKPLIGVHHIAGHIYANNYEKDIVYPALCLVVSGGHTELVLMKHPYSFEVIGETLDDAVGEAYDKVGRVLNLPYPGGPVLDKMAHLGKASYHLPKPLDDDSYNFSFSGLKSAVINYLHKAEQKKEEVNFADVAASFQAAVGDVLVQKTLAALEELGHQKLALVGGVASNQYLRNRLETELKKRNIQLIVPSKELCTDNAAMIGSRAYYQWKENRVADFSLNATPAWVLGK